MNYNQSFAKGVGELLEMAHLMVDYDPHNDYFWKQLYEIEKIYEIAVQQLSANHSA